MAEKWGFSREDLEEFALESHRRAGKAIEGGYFDREIAPHRRPLQGRGRPPRHDPGEDGGAEAAARGLGHHRRPSPRRSPSAPSALLIASEEAVKRHNLTPRARIHTLAVCGSDPVYMLTGPIPATEKALERAA